MSVLTIPQTIVYAKNAGFTGTSVARIVAIAMCESGLNTHGPDNINSDSMHSRDRGLYQINSYWHSEVSDACAYDPACASNAAYRISSSGSNFNPWSTYTNGCSDKNIAAVNASMGSPTSSSTPGIKPWYTFPRVDNLGGVEPFGGFPKPDSNIQIPANYPVTALLPGTVTAIDSGNVAWGGVITILLDKPINSIATHTAYLHLASELVTVGQHVSSGQLIAYNGGSSAQGSQKVPLGFALYNGDHYGQGSAWSLMTKANLNGGPLDPVPLLNQAANGQLLVGNGTQGIGTTLSNTITTVSNQANQLVNQIPGFLGICEALDIVEQFVPFTLPTQGSQDITTATQNTDVNIFGWDTGVSNPFAIAQATQAAVALPADAMQAVLVFTVTNFAAFAIRALFVTCGLVLFFSLMINLVSEVMDVKDVAKTVETVAPLMM